MTPAPLPSPPPAWQISQQNGRAILTLSGDWLAQNGAIPAFPAKALSDARALPGAHALPGARALNVDMTAIGRWDTGLIEFLWDASRAAQAAGVTLQQDTLPAPVRKLLGLLPGAPAVPQPPPRWRFRPLFGLGGAIIGMFTETGILTTLLANTGRGAFALAAGRARIRPGDLLGNVWDAGPSALIIVGVVNFLIGAILAFVGAAQLRKFAADAYVANLVGLALVREMAAVMTAIVMAGRTGGAYAARIATMEGGEEIDALRVFGIPVSDYILLPSILALVFTMPLLYLYGCLIGMLGGLVVAGAMLNITVAGYLHQTLDAVPLDQFVFGFCKSIAFAVLIGVTSCRIGLKAGRSAADVGLAATSAVVTGIVGVIALDAVFAVIADTVGI